MPKKTTAKKYWTPHRVARLRMWFGRGLEFTEIANHFKGKSTNSIYKKLGRMGILNNNWSRRIG